MRRGTERPIKKPLRKTHQEDAYENSTTQSHNSHRVLHVLGYAFKSSIHLHVV